MTDMPHTEEDVNNASRPATPTTTPGVAGQGEPPHPTVPFHIEFTEDTSLYEVLDAFLFGPFLSGEQPHNHSTMLRNVKKDHPLLPPNARVRRTVTFDRRTGVLADGPGWTSVTWRFRDHGGSVHVTAETEELAREVLRKATEDATEEPSTDESDVTVGFWFDSARRGPDRTTRHINAQAWPDIRPNYATQVVETVDGLMKLTPEQITGRLILLHGPPGTGKTTALRSLARAWREWCQMDCILDPERLFNDPSYLMEVAIGENDTSSAGWRLLLLEDCDELIRTEAKNVTGQALSRLLNLTDGLLGQGRNILIGITTNEDVEKLHPAVVRPGRCLARAEVGPLPYDEAVAWLGHSAGVAPEGATLAELYALHSKQGPLVVDRPEQAQGMYL